MEPTEEEKQKLVREGFNYIVNSLKLEGIDYWSLTPETHKILGIVFHAGIEYTVNLSKRIENMEGGEENEQ